MGEPLDPWAGPRPRVLRPGIWVRPMTLPGSGLPLGFIWVSMAWVWQSSDNSPGLGPGRVRSWFSFLLQHLLRLSSNFYIYSISLQHFLRLFSNFYNFCYSCCSLFGQLLFIVQKSARAMGAVREPLGSGIITCFTFWGHLFHTQFCTLPFAPTNQIFVKTCTKNCAQIH